MARHNDLGTQIETAAEDFYTQKNYQLLARNFRCRQGEVDLIVEKNQELVFVEVKARVSCHSDFSWESPLSLKQQRRVSRAADYFMSFCYQGEAERVRFDLLVWDGFRWTHLPEAWFNEGYGA